MVNVQTDDLPELAVRKFLSAHLAVPLEKIKLSDGLFHDLGVDGDDAIELLEEYSKEFGVDVNYADMSKYFGPELSSPLQFVLSLISNFSNNKIPDLTVRRLVDGTKSGFLSDEKND